MGKGAGRRGGEMAKDYVFETERLRMRKPIADDADRLYALTEGEEMRTFLAMPEPNRTENLNRLLRNAGSWLLFGYGIAMVEEKASGDFVGTCGIFRVDRGHGDDFNIPEAGWIIDQNHWGKGYATEAMQGAIQWFEGEFGKQPLGCMIEFGNVASDKVARKLGFKILREVEENEEDDRAAHLVLYRRD